MRDQRKVSDYLHPQPDAPSASDRLRPDSHGNEAAALSTPEEARLPTDEERRRLAELEELAGMLQKLHATMDTALNTVADARKETQDAVAEEPAPEAAHEPLRMQQPSAEVAQDRGHGPQEPAEVPQNPLEVPEPDAGMPPPRAPRLHAELKPEPGPKPEPVAARAPRSRWRKNIMLSGVGVSAGVVALALLGWLWHANSVLDAGSVQSAKSEKFISLDPAPLAGLPAPQASRDTASGTPGGITKTNARAPMAAEVTEAPAKTNETGAPAVTGQQPQQQSAQALLADETLYGVAGEPVPLGIVLPEGAADGKLSVAVEGVTGPATITGGTRLGGETWMVDARQATNAALLTPATYPGGQFRMNVRLVSNDGGITQAQALTVAVEQSQAFAATADAGQEGTDAGPQEAAPMVSARPAMVPASGEQPAPAATPVPSRTQTATAVHEDQTQPLVRAEEVASAQSGAAQPAASRPSLVGQPSPAPQQPAGTAADAGQPVAPAEADQAQAEPARSEPVTTYVNMRAEPSNDGEVIAVVPAGKSVGVIECGRHWCEVTYAEKRGWIYKRFVGEGRISQRATPAVLASYERRDGPAADARKPSSRSTAQAARPSRTVPVTADTNMRTEPSGNAAVVTVVPKDGQVGVVRCGKWCEVTYAGKRGWIHSNLIGQTRSAENSADDKKDRKGFWKKIWPF